MTKKEAQQKEVLNEKVSIHTLMMHAHSAYIRGCLVERQRLGIKRTFKFCKVLADKYLETDIKSILFSEQKSTIEK